MCSGVTSGLNRAPDNWHDPVSNRITEITISMAWHDRCPMRLTETNTDEMIHCDSELVDRFILIPKLMSSINLPPFLKFNTT